VAEPVGEGRDFVLKPEPGLEELGLMRVQYRRAADKIAELSEPCKIPTCLMFIDGGRDHIHFAGGKVEDICGMLCAGLKEVTLGFPEFERELFIDAFAETCKKFLRERERGGENAN
jgi:hypothetical protein